MHSTVATVSFGWKTPLTPPTPHSPKICMREEQFFCIQFAVYAVAYVFFEDTSQISEALGRKPVKISFPPPTNNYNSHLFFTFQNVKLHWFNGDLK